MPPRQATTPTLEGRGVIADVLLEKLRREQMLPPSAGAQEP